MPQICLSAIATVLNMLQTMCLEKKQRILNRVTQRQGKAGIKNSEKNDKLILFRSINESANSSLEN